MLNPNEIHPKHLPSLQAAILKNKSRLDEHRVAKIYKEAQRIFRENESAIVQDRSVQISRYKVENTNLVVSTCTDVETGLFVQLAGSIGAKEEELMLIFGQKFCQEVKDGMRQNTATKIW